MNEIKSNGCVYCRKHSILEQAEWHVYTDRTYEYIRSYESFDEIKSPNHQLLRNIVREERWLTAHNGKVYSILSPNEGKLDLNKSLTEKELMKERILRSKLSYIIGIHHKQKKAYYGSSATEMSLKLINIKNGRLVNRKTIAKHLNANTEYAGLLMNYLIVIML